MANRRRRKFQRVPEKINETVIPQGVFISNDYKNKISVFVVMSAVILFLYGMFIGISIKND